MPPPAGYIVTPLDQQGTRSANDTAEYRRNSSKEHINALYALDNGWDGTGVTVGVMDDGVNVSLDEFKGQISDLSKDFGYETRGGVRTKRNSLGDATSVHGTPVAGIIGARVDGVGTSGIAPGAKLAVLRVNDFNFDTGVEQISRGVDALNYAGSVGIKVINSSLASDGLSPGFRDAVTRYGVTGGLLVNGAGNSGGANPMDALNVNDANRDTWLFVGALSSSIQSYTIATYSNRAGTMADRTVFAIGTNASVLADGRIGNFSGTSSATPQVSALAALILDKWPQLNGRDAGNVILSTARDIGAVGVDEVYGHGLIDVRAALSPVNPTISNGRSKTSLGGSYMAVADVIDTTALKVALSDVTILDEFGRDFSGSIAGMVIQAEEKGGHWLRRRVAQVDRGHAFAVGNVTGSFGYVSDQIGQAGQVRSVLTNGQIAYRTGRTTFRAGVNAHHSLQSDIMGLAPISDGVLAYAPQAGSSLGLDRQALGGRVGLTISVGREGQGGSRAATLSFDRGDTTVRATVIDETGSVMGAASGGGLSLGRGATTMLIEGRQTFGIGGGWSLEGYGSVGVTRLKIDAASVVTGVTDLVGTRIGLQANGPLLGGVFSLGVAQPLFFESGEAELTLGNGYDLASRSLTYGVTEASLASSQRRLQLSAGFARTWMGSSLRLGVMRDLTDGGTKALSSFSFMF